ncbi:15172_t:CDS:1, partial [Acaulospora colombiana]
EGEKTYPRLYKEGIRYLGVYLSNKSSYCSTKNKLLEKILKFTNAISSQKGWNGLITRQASHWIIPAQLEYAINATVPSDNEMVILQRKMNKPIKARLGVKHIISNKILYSPASLNIVKLQNCCDLTTIKILTVKLTNLKIFPVTSREIISIQAAQAIWCCPICFPYYFTDSWIISTALLAKRYNIRICPLPCPFNHNNHENSIGLNIKLTKATALSLYYSNIKTI